MHSEVAWPCIVLRNAPFHHNRHNEDGVHKLAYLSARRPDCQELDSPLVISKDVILSQEEEVYFRLSSSLHVSKCTLCNHNHSIHLQDMQGEAELDNIMIGLGAFQEPSRKETHVQHTCKPISRACAPLLWQHEWQSVLCHPLPPSWNLCNA